MPIKRANDEARGAQGRQRDSLLDLRLPRPVTKERGEGRGEGDFVNLQSLLKTVSDLGFSKSKVPLLAVFCLLFSLAVAADQQPAGSTVKGFKAPLEYFEPPHELQVKTFLEGTEAVPGTNGIIIHNAKLQTYHEDGSWEMTATAPNCLWDSRQQTVSSPGPMQVLTADEKYLFHHEGVGFIWMQTNSDFFISNNVCTTITPLTNSPTP
jgi:hypothetical protein